MFHHVTGNSAQLVLVVELIAFGAGVEVYRQTRNEIARHIEARLDALL